MGNILTAKVEIEGVRPLLWHHFGPDALPVEKRVERTGVAGNDPEEWRKTVLMTKERQLYLLPTYAFACIREAARHTKKGKGSIQSNVGATLQVTDDILMVDRFVPEAPITTDLSEPVYMYVASVRNPATKARNVRYRVAAGTGCRTQATRLRCSTGGRARARSGCARVRRAIAVGDTIRAQIKAPLTFDEWMSFFGSGRYFAGEPQIPTIEKAAEVTRG